MRSVRYILSITFLIFTLAWSLMHVFAGYGNPQDPCFWLYKYETLTGGWMPVGTLLTGGLIVRLFGAHLLPLRIAGWLCTVAAIALPYCALQDREGRRNNLHWLAISSYRAAVLRLAGPRGKEKQSPLVGYRFRTYGLRRFSGVQPRHAICTPFVCSMGNEYKFLAHNPSPFAHHLGACYSSAFSEYIGIIGTHSAMEEEKPLEYTHCGCCCRAHLSSGRVSSHTGAC